MAPSLTTDNSPVFPHSPNAMNLDVAHPESVTENKYRVMYIDERGMLQLQLQLISYNIHDVFIKS